MEVTRFNYPQLYSFVKSTLQKAHFISFDLEFSGLYLHPNLRNTSLDSMEHRYLKLHTSITSFCPLQIGLCAFNLMDSGAQATPFSFYLYPSSPEVLDRTYSFQASSMNFLSQHGFDFNKAIGEGLGFLNSKEKQLLKDKEVQAKREFNRAGVTDEMKAYLNWARDKVLEKPGEEVFLDGEYVKSSVLYYTIRELEKEFELIGEVKKEGTCNLGIELKPGKREHTAEDIRGFSEVIDMIQGKPLVGHNMLMDLMHLYDKFVEPLPPSLYEFLSGINSRFPVVYDTKHMIQSSTYLKNFFDKDYGVIALEESFKTIQKDTERFKNYPIHVDKAISNELPHDAAFDAFSTGSLFLRLLSLLDTDFKSSHKSLKHLKNTVPVAGRKIPLKLDSKPREENYQDIFVITLDEHVTPESVKAVLEQEFGSVAVYKIFWSKDIFYVMPSSLESRELMKQLSGKTRFEVENTVGVLRSYHDFVKQEETLWGN